MDSRQPGGRSMVRREERPRSAWGREMVEKHVKSADYQVGAVGMCKDLLERSGTMPGLPRPRDSDGNCGACVGDGGENYDCY